MAAHWDADGSGLLHYTLLLVEDLEGTKSFIALVSLTAEDESLQNINRHNANVVREFAELIIPFKERKSTRGGI